MDDTDLKELLQERAEGVRMDPNPRLPRPMLRRARRRRALTGAVAGLTAAVVVAGAVVGIQAAFHEKAQPKPAHHGPSPAPSGGTSSAVRFPGIWPVANRPELASLFRDRAGIVHFKSVLTPTEAALAFASHVLQWAPSRTVVHGSQVAGGHARVTLWNEDMGRFSPQIGLNVDLQRFSQGAREVWVVTRAQSGLMDVRCPPPRQDVLLPGAPINVCGRLSQPPSEWTMGATVEYAASELQPSEAQNGTNPVIAGRAFKGTIVLTATYADADVTLAIRLFSGSGATLGIDVRRLQIGSSPTGTGGAGLPAEVERTRLAILRAVRAGNYSKLQPLIPPKGFTFTTGRQSNPIGYWKTKGFDPLHVMGELLRMPYAIAYSGTKITYVWPSLFETTAKQKARLSPALKAKLAYIYPDIDKELRRWMGPNGYTGWRLGIESDGTWVFFVTND